MSLPWTDPIIPHLNRSNVNRKIQTILRNVTLYVEKWGRIFIHFYQLAFFFSQVFKKYVLGVYHSTMIHNEENSKQYKWQKFKCIRITLMLQDILWEKQVELEKEQAEGCFYRRNFWGKYLKIQKWLTIFRKQVFFFFLQIKVWPGEREAVFTGGYTRAFNMLVTLRISKKVHSMKSFPQAFAKNNNNKSLKSTLIYYQESQHFGKVKIIPKIQSHNRAKNTIK